MRQVLTDNRIATFLQQGSMMKTTFVKALAACMFTTTMGMQAQHIEERPFGALSDEQKVMEYTLSNENGMVVKVINYGGIMTELWVPDRDGKVKDVLLGYDSLEGYQSDTAYFGALIGRYGNRIGGAAFNLNGKRYELSANEGDNHLHGGELGFNKVLWKADTVSTPDSVAVELRYVSPDGEMGYPGTLEVQVRYELNNDNELSITYRATTDKPTVCNLTQHNYYNLRGHGEGSVLDHELILNADAYTPVGSTLIPTGELAPVEGTPMDFRKARPIGSRIEQSFEQLKHGAGYDHNWVLNKEKVGELSFAARLYEPDSGRVMEIFTTEPGIQFYSGNFLEGGKGKNGTAYHFRYGLCLETQHFPDSPNQPNFPSTQLNPGQVYSSKTVHRFSTQ